MAKEVKVELLEKTKEQFKELELMLQACQVDMLKNANGVLAAGPRSRKALRLLKQKCQEAILYSTEVSKEYSVKKQD